MFCFHDWTPFKKSVPLVHNSKTRWNQFSGNKYIVYEHYYSSEPCMNKKINKKIGTTYKYSLGYFKDGEFITDDVCSKCFKLRLNLQKAKEKSMKREAKDDKRRRALNRKKEKKAEKNRLISDRRNKSKEWAAKFISMKEKA